MSCNYSTQAYYAIVTTCAYCMHSHITTFCSWQRPGILLASLYLLRVSSVTGELAYTYQYQQFTTDRRFLCTNDTSVCER